MKSILFGFCKKDCLHPKYLEWEGLIGRGLKGDFDAENELQKPHRIEFTSVVTLRELQN